MKIPNHYPNQLWYYDTNNNKISPSWADIYYCDKYSCYVYLFANKRIDSEILVDIDELRQEFMQSNYDNLSKALSNKRLLSFWKNLKKNKVFKDNYFIKAKCVVVKDDTSEYQIVVPKSSELLYEITDMNIEFDTYKKSAAILKYIANQHVSSYTNGKYKNIYEYYTEECHTIQYAEFLQYVNKIRIEYLINKSSSGKKCFLLNLGKLTMPFPFGNIGFFSQQKQDTLYYSPVFNIFLYKSQIAQDSQFGEYEDIQYQLIEVPIFTSPANILKENNINADICYYEKKQQQMYMTYNINTIYVDTFFREYGYRTEQEISLIYKSICKYKQREYQWLVDRGAKIYLNDNDRIDLEIKV